MGSVNTRGESVYLEIIRNRSGVDSGNIDMSLKVSEIAALIPEEQLDVATSTAIALESVLRRLPRELKKRKDYLLARIIAAFDYDESEEALTLLFESAELRAEFLRDADLGRKVRLGAV